MRREKAAGDVHDADWPDAFYIDSDAGIPDEPIQSNVPGMGNIELDILVREERPAELRVAERDGLGWYAEIAAQQGSQDSPTYDEAPPMLREDIPIRALALFPA